ncbi:LIPR2-like protein, partial [Mya arenaria]
MYYFIYNRISILCNKADVNVILVFWGKGANVGITMYDQAATNTRVVAAEIKVLVLKMVSLGSDVSQVHLIGHSLGAHTSGYVGSRLKSDDNLVLGRITGLDPAEPDFEKQPMLVRLDKNDATYVDVIHTNGAPMLGGGGFGLMIQCGDVDFYVNGGELQPDCPNQITGIFTSGMAAGDVVACSHSRAHDIFTETINAQMCQFVGYPCASYASHQYKVLVGVSHSGKTTKGKLEIQLAGTWATSEWFPATAA